MPPIPRPQPPNCSTSWGAPALLAAGPLAAQLPIEVDRTAQRRRVVSVAGRSIPIEFQHADRRVSLRLDGPLLHLVVDGILTRTMPARSQRARRLEYSLTQAALYQPHMSIQ